jgi:hypothetical protein
MIAITTNNSIKVKAPNALDEFSPCRIKAACQNSGTFAKHFFSSAAFYPGQISFRVFRVFRG